jgi:hypothetical protein
MPTPTTLLLECGIICPISKRDCSQEDFMDSDTALELYTIWGEAKNHIEQGDYDKAIEIYK